VTEKPTPNSIVGCYSASFSVVGWLLAPAKALSDPSSLVKKIQTQTEPRALLCSLAPPTNKNTLQRNSSCSIRSKQQSSADTDHWNLRLHKLYVAICTRCALAK
jgi:hypothetical protein